MAVVKSRVLRIILGALGWVFVGIAFVGVFIPVMPTTGPVILAAFLFSKSSERFDHWLVTNRFFGSIVRDWRDGLGFTVRAKVVAVTAVLLSFTITTVLVIHDTRWRVSFWLLAAGISLFIITRPTKSSTDRAEVSAEQASA
jgi:uncharacterized membrane protein YbaN (DUF454 family)